MASGKAVGLMGELINRHGAPDHIRSDNGPKFVAKSIQQWLAEESIRTLYLNLDVRGRMALWMALWIASTISFGLSFDASHWRAGLELIEDGCAFVTQRLQLTLQR